MIVEFVGISGVGKTTIAHKYVEDEKAKGTEICWLTQLIYTNKSWLKRNLIKSFAVFFYILIHPLWSIKFLHFLMMNKFSLRDLSVLFFNGIFLRRNLRKAMKGEGVYLFDEGILQFIWAICLRIDKNLSEERIISLISMFEMPDILYVVQAPAQIIEQRLLARGVNERILKFDNLNEKIRSMQKSEEYIIDVIKKHKLMDMEKINYIYNP